MGPITHTAYSRLP